MLVLDAYGTPVPLVDLKEVYLARRRVCWKYVKKYYNSGEAPERSVDVEIAIV
jgi:isoleucyl-tRNA synthetase